MPASRRARRGTARLTAYGHSWVQGDGASSPAHRLVGVAAAELGCAPRNLGVGGSLSTQTAALVSRVAPPPSELYLLMTGLNDARLHGEDPRALDTYAAALCTIVGAFLAVSPRATVIVVEQPHLADYSRHAPHDRGSSRLVERYNARLRRLAAELPGVVPAQVAGWDARSMLADDTVHPNDLGHATVGHAVAQAYRWSVSSMASTRPVQD